MVFCFKRGRSASRIQTATLRNFFRALQTPERDGAAAVRDPRDNGGALVALDDDVAPGDLRICRGSVVASTGAGIRLQRDDRCQAGAAFSTSNEASGRTRNGGHRVSEGFAGRGRDRP